MDHYSRYTWVFFLSGKSNIFNVFKGFAKQAKNAFEFKVKKIRSDNDAEFNNSRIEDYCDKKGIKHEFLAKYTRRKTGLVKGRIRL
jgi:hypothetical protein